MVAILTIGLYSPVERRMFSLRLYSRAEYLSVHNRDAEIGDLPNLPLKDYGGISNPAEVL